MPTRMISTFAITLVLSVTMAASRTTSVRMRSISSLGGTRAKIATSGSSRNDNASARATARPR